MLGYDTPSTTARVSVGNEGLNNLNLLKIQSSPSWKQKGISQSVGIVLNLAMLTQVSRDIPTTIVTEIVNMSKHLICLDDLDTNFDKTIVLLNGKILGYTENYKEFINEMKEFKLSGFLDKQISVTYNNIDNEVRIFCDEGRLIRPVYNVVDNDFEINHEQKTWKELVDSNKIVYIDNNEAAESVIAMEYNELSEFECNYLEIAPAMMLGVMASIIPFSNHSQAPRICYQSAMGKQALGIHSLAHNLRSDTSSYVMDYPQKPLVSTLTSRYMGFDDMPSGVNAIVAIMCYTGFNQEDSIIMNKSSVERGLFGVTSYRTVVFNEKKKLVFGVSENICVPSKDIRKKNYNYSLLDKNGIVKKGSYVSIGDVLVGKIKIKQQKNVDEKSDCSFVSKSVEETGYVDRIIISETNGQKLVKITLRKIKTPEVGDKFAARSAQKATVGIMLPQEDMPFTQDGITPDIIMNAHALPSRMTLNQLMETVLGKRVCMDGKFGDSTPFTKNGDDVSNILCENLKKYGFEASGTEVMYSGFTGEPLEARVFIGPTYYQRLKHMVSNKMHSRATGHVTTLLRQPLEGRSRDGGLRFGEMERDCLEGGTSISLTNGLSVSIKTLSKCNNEVYGWDKNLDGMIPSMQNNFLYKGERECIELTYEDGRQITCTKEHRFLVDDNKWIYAKDIVPNKTKVKVSINNPHVDIEEEIKLCNDWTLDVGEIKLKTESYYDYNKTLAFMRILGYLLTDGTISKSKTGQLRMMVFLGHILDVNLFVKDLSMFCEITQENFECENGYNIYIPKNISKNIIEIEGLIIGNRINQDGGLLPNFIMEESCPLPIIREFLGGLYGGDGHTPGICKRSKRLDTITSVDFSKSKKLENLKSLTEELHNLKKLLKKFDIHTTIQKPKRISYRVNDNETYEQKIHVEIRDISKFAEKIGFRYCCHKSVRLEAGKVYRNYLVFNKTKCSSTEYFKKIGAMEFFEKRKFGVLKEKIALPTMELRVVAINSVGLKPVYDIQVNHTESFLANGVVAHNCMISHGCARFLRERLFDQSDPYYVNVCNSCKNVSTTSKLCKGCNNDKITTVNLPYAAKLLFQEINSMGIKILISPKE